MYCQILPRPPSLSPSFFLPMLPTSHYVPPSVSWALLVSDVVYFCGTKRYPDRPTVHQMAAHTRLASAGAQSCCLFFTVMKLWNKQRRTSTQPCGVYGRWRRNMQTSFKWMGEKWKHTRAVLMPLWVCEARACAEPAPGGALSRYQVVFPSAPERALIVLLFNLLVILDARQEPFSQT